ncbi:LPS assembly lipoprotein LptE [Vannielia litorea]|uniref:LPS-assembly lipoprotein n=1 Tax=Vannielia litorea TaxID=1217970 RepID=A0A1N6HCJ3_9RHOB|nr:LPS assembly lipoprotein LptE [Vannielia litorea]SIO17490.1 LPS-assembly lipoprotein [Vannielia litorea]
MWWRSALFGGLALLGACGFAPLYGPGGPGETLHGQVEIAEPTTENEFDFVSRLETRLGRTAAGPMRLDYAITTRREGLAITADQETQRYNILGEVRYQVTDTTTNVVLSTGRTHSFTSYSATGTTVATTTAARDAEARLMVILADQAVTHLLATAESFLP